MSALLHGLDDARLVVVAGPGGVGKTTSAAAIAVALAQSGRRTLVLTADPARRLADTLGVSAVATTSAAVEIAGLPLRVAMLESQRAFETLLPHMVPDPAARARIERSPVYQRFSRSLARSHAYAAIERLHEARFGAEASTLDVVVLDTPPMRGMLDLLDAPLALSRFSASRAVDVFGAGQSSMFGWAARRALEAVAGPELGAGLAEFLAAFGPFRSGFSQRARLVAEAQRAGDTRTVLVTRGEPLRIGDARALATALWQRDIACTTLIGSAAIARQEEPWSLDATTLPAGHERALRAAHARGGRDRAEGARHRAELLNLARSLGTPLVSTPALPSEPASIAALSQLARGARLAGPDA